MNSALQPIPVSILEEAADWLMRLDEGELNSAEQDAFQRWYHARPEHARAWQRAQSLLRKLETLPPALTLPVLDSPSNVGRRAALLKFGALGLALPLGWLAWRTAGHGTDYRTARGEQREFTLAEGSRLTLNTASAVDVVFDARQRLILLHRGELLIDTAPDAPALNRPFFVQTAAGLLQALGTRFSVRCEAQRTLLAVQQGAVRITPKLGGETAALTLAAGNQASFTAQAVEAPRPLDAAALAWTSGMLLADAMRLEDFIEELARYRRGVLRLDPQLADLRISGAFPLGDTDQALAMLTSTHSLRLDTLIPGYWVNIAAL